MILMSHQSQRSPIPFVDLKGQFRGLHDEVMAGIEEALAGMNLLLGPNVRAFETEFASYCDARHAIGVANGTDALYLALRACGVGKGDEVITVSHSFIATAEAIVILGAAPVYVDVDPVTYTLDPSKLEAAITPKTKAIIPVHLYGQMADMDPIMEIAQRRGLVVIEDACQAHGAEYKGRRAGSIGDAAAFSFYMGKNLGAYGDAGAITTNSQAVADHVRLLRDHGSTTKYHHTEMGYNSRLDELQAVFLRIKLPYLDGWNAARRTLASVYDRVLEDLGVVTPVAPPDRQHVFHLYVIQTDDRARVQESLQKHGIATGIHYPTPIHLQPASHNIGRVVGDMTVTDSISGRILSLPMYAELTHEQIAYIASRISHSLSTRGVTVGD